MSNKPKLGKATKEQKAKQQALDEGLAIGVNGARYEVRFGDLTAMDVSALRRETGYSWQGLLTAANEQPDIDVVAVIVWLHRRLAGEKLLPFEAVANELDYSMDVELLDDEAPQKAATPGE